MIKMIEWGMSVWRKGNVVKIEFMNEFQVLLNGIGGRARIFSLYRGSRVFCVLL